MKKLSASPNEVRAIANGVTWAKSRARDHCELVFSRRRDIDLCLQVAKSIFFDIDYTLERVLGPSVRFSTVSGCGRRSRRGRRGSGLPSFLGFVC